MFLGSAEADLLGNFTPISRWSAKNAMKTAWVHSGAFRAQLCIQGDIMAYVTGWREIRVLVGVGSLQMYDKHGSISKTGKLKKMKWRIWSAGACGRGFWGRPVRLAWHARLQAGPETGARAPNPPF